MEKIPETLPKQITDLYETSRNTFIRKDKGEVAEEREVEIGDVNSDDFQPQVKLKQWDNETNFSVRLIDDELDKPTIETEDNKIKFIKNKLEAHFYNTKIGEKKETDGFEFEVLLKEKPKTNKVQMSIESKGLKFYYQPELTQEEKDDGAFRPENVVGSYAVYHESKAGDYSKMGLKNYRAGKAFHIYRPKIIDNAGKEVWGELNITDNLLTVEIPQEFLDSAVYPVIVDPTFGAAGQGGSNTATGSNRLRGIQGTTDASGGTAQSVTMWVKQYSSNTPNIKGYIFLQSNDSYVGKTDQWALTSSWDGEKTINFTNQPNLAASTDYVVAINTNGAYSVYYDSFVDPPPNEDDSYTYDGIGSTSFIANNRKFSIYCTYTAGGGGTNMKINIGDVFKDVSEIKINIGDAWKTVSEIKINIGDVWKTIFSILLVLTSMALYL